MPALVRRLNLRTLADALRRAPYVLVRVDRNPTFHEGVVDFLDATFPGMFAFGTLERAEAHPEALAATFQTAAGPLRRGVTDGYYLFGAGGKVIGQHAGQSRPIEFAGASDPDEEQFRVRVLKVIGWRPPEVVEPVRQLAMYFVPIVERKQQAGASPWDDPFLGRTGSTPPAVGRVAAPPTGDPYAVLQVSPSATDEEVRAAFRAQLLLNHPDRVAHLSPALQAFARQQVLAIQAAWDRIAKLRRL
jgi:DnaJ-domain-containing protein 1